MNANLPPSNTLRIPPSGKEEEWILDPRPVPYSPEHLIQYKCRYGSSLKIIAQGEELIGDEFTSSNPNKDWKKYKKAGKELMYCIIEDMASDVVICAARAIIDFPCVENSKSNKVFKRNVCEKKRIILDYIHTAETCRGQGLAAEVVRFLQRIAKTEGTDFYVLAIEESQGYFLSKFGMILEQDANLGEHYNCFSDTFLLKSPDNITGSKDMNLHESFIDKNAETAEAAQTDEESGSEDDGLEKAIQESLTSVSHEIEPVEHVSSDEESDDELKQAIQESLNTSRTQNSDLSVKLQLPATLGSSNELTEQQQIELAMRASLNEDVNVRNSLDKDVSKDIPSEKILESNSDLLSNELQNSVSEEEMLRQAIALSLLTGNDDNEKRLNQSSDASTKQ